VSAHTSILLLEQQGNVIFFVIRKENSHMKSLKKQHEAALAEIQEQRTQVRRKIFYFVLLFSSPVASTLD
jgi:hypothetical protein